MTNKEDQSSITLLPLVWGVSQAVALSLVITALVGTVYYFTNVSEPGMNMMVLGGFGLCASWAGWSAARRSSSKSIIYGIMAGVLFFVITWLLGWIVSAPTLAATAWWKKMIYAVVGSSLGSVVSVIGKD
ncbi:TIGR04086 family membrane protein [Heliophilum fasciatum]|uniref:Putative membrane protein (TIGR04086 family) n=1 Tax=Heliophilum fasciatum TaxID=35700 RepID=A0A4R2RGJ1_9FIRM|nr:TIGR04086 family membrane protein [Heliophilum fasciatum]MCW2278930.1 putative membrane protein (TIGR04086 family) [Heliophilum fasciatum]TCP62063.1 putative membrane protein (TIGR04086 family) [Heliophilum fasciatum]